jgi:hypothetical protein
MFQSTCVRLQPCFCSILFQEIADAPGFASITVRDADGFLRIQCQPSSEVTPSIAWILSVLGIFRQLSDSFQVADGLDSHHVYRF